MTPALLIGSVGRSSKSLVGLYSSGGGYHYGSMVCRCRLCIVPSVFVALLLVQLRFCVYV
jgi:hypothetical protein